MAEALRVALIGFGLAGSVFHAPLIEATPGLLLAAIMTSNPERSRQVRLRYPQAQLFASADELWTEGGKFDLAVVAAPNRLHLPLALAALDHGLHVVVDKPMATSLQEAQVLARRAIERGRVLSVFHNRRWDGDFLTVQRILQEETLGPITRFESRFERWRPQPRAQAWRELESHETGGGLLLDLISHLVDQAVQLFGRPLHVYAELDSRRPGVQGDDDCFLALEFSDRVRAHLWASCLARVPGPRFLLRGMAGSYQKFGLDPQEEALRAGVSPLAPHWGEEDPEQWGILTTEVERRRETRPGDYSAYYKELERSLRENRQAPVTAQEALLVMEILDAAKLSADSGSVVDFRSTRPD